MSEDELEAIRRRRMAELQRRLATEQTRVQEQEEMELKIHALLRRILTPKARQRLTNLKMVKPEFARQMELQLIQIAQQRRINLPITDEQLKNLLKRLQGTRREMKIRRV